MKIEVGKSYKNKYGEVYKIVYCDNDETTNDNIYVGWNKTQSRNYYEDGAFRNHPTNVHDLIEEVLPEVEVYTILYCHTTHPTQTPHYYTQSFTSIEEMKDIISWMEYTYKDFKLISTKRIYIKPNEFDH